MHLLAPGHHPPTGETLTAQADVARDVLAASGQRTRLQPVNRPDSQELAELALMPCPPHWQPA
jgi:hypothetical protein